jgi:isopenicillin N synthase-like dioxygenase
MDHILEIDVVEFERGDERTRRAIVDGMRRSLETGFVYARHDLPVGVLDDAYHKLETFFSLAAEVKNRYTVVGSAGQTGYTGMRVETPVSVGKPDLKEMYNWSAELPAGHPLRRRFPHRYRDQKTSSRASRRHCGCCTTASSICRAAFCASSPWGSGSTRTSSMEW